MDTGVLSYAAHRQEGARPELDVMWWDPAPADFAIGSAVRQGLGHLAPKRLSPFLPPINDLIGQCTELQRDSPTLAIPLFGEIIQHIVMLLEQLQTLPTTFTKMVFAVTSLQCAFLELDALYSYMTIYKPRMSNYWPPPPPCARTICRLIHDEVFDTENILAVVPLREPRLGLPDDNTQGTGAPPVLYTGNSTREKIAVIQHAAVHTPWYHDPFETADTRARSPSPDPVIPIANCPIGSTSGSVAVASGSSAASNHLCFPPPALSHAIQSAVRADPPETTSPFGDNSAILHQ
ncbi:hypothetical protein B0H10DRAFT_1941839 [Mycena sp. CBHHK59/15]|nr:hypothetical protein B0H10DRAFT_1941839 [Mycena sp. CBHHK59/15]